MTNANETLKSGTIYHLMFFAQYFIMLAQKLTLNCEVTNNSWKISLWKSLFNISQLIASLMYTIRLPNYTIMDCVPNCNTEKTRIICLVLHYHRQYIYLIWPLLCINVVLYGNTNLSYMWMVVLIYHNHGDVFCKTLWLVHQWIYHICVWWY